MKCAPTLPEIYSRYRPGHPDVWRWLVNMSFAQNPSILDVGCGPGIEAAALNQLNSDFTYTGVDFAEDAIIRAQASTLSFSNLNFTVASAEELPFKDCSFDIATFFLSLHQLKDPAYALQEANRVTRENGTIAVLLVEKCDWQQAFEYEYFRGLIQIEDLKSGWITAEAVETWLHALGICTIRRKFHYLNQCLDMHFLEACTNKYFSSLSRLHSADFLEGIDKLTKRVSSLSMPETRCINCTLISGKKVL